MSFFSVIASSMVPTAGSSDRCEKCRGVVEELEDLLAQREEEVGALTREKEALETALRELERANAQGEEKARRCESTLERHRRITAAVAESLVRTPNDTVLAELTKRLESDTGDQLLLQQLVMEAMGKMAAENEALDRQLRVSEAESLLFDLSGSPNCDAFKVMQAIRIGADPNVKKDHGAESALMRFIGNRSMLALTCCMDSPFPLHFPSLDHLSSGSDTDCAILEMIVRRVERHPQDVVPWSTKLLENAACYSDARLSEVREMVKGLPFFAGLETPTSVKECETLGDAEQRRFKLKHEPAE